MLRASPVLAPARGAMPPVSELTFRRATINLTDAARLGEGEDLNDALLDFFVKAGQYLIPEGGDVEAPTAYLGSHFFKQLRSAFATSGEEGWKNVQNWAKRKAGGLFKPQYMAFSVPINEDLKDDKGEDAGNHWWLALVLNPPGGAKGEPMAVMCLDSMQRREKEYSPPLVSAVKGSLNRYTVQVTKVEQAGYLVIVTFDAAGDGTFGPLPRPEGSRLLVGEVECTEPTLGLRVNMPGGDGVPGRFEGTLTFALDGRIRSSAFEFDYGGGDKYNRVKLEFDPFLLTKLQKDVSRFLGGYLAKEWDTNGPSKKLIFQKQSARALVADVYQQENLNDCGVFVLENTLRSLSMKGDFLRSMADASPKALKSFPWPTQQEVTARKQKLKGIVAELFASAAQNGSSDVEVLLKKDPKLREDMHRSLTDGHKSELDNWSGNLQKELAARQLDKDKTEAELKMKEDAVQERRMEERRKREEAAAKAEHERLEGKRPPGRSRVASDSRSRSRSPVRNKKSTKRSPPARRPARSSDSSECARRKKPMARRKQGAGKKRNRSPSSSRPSLDSRSCSSDVGRRKKRR